ncbi:hypothetical protein D3C72_1538030 [compost metagenome]
MQQVRQLQFQADVRVFLHEADPGRRQQAAGKVHGRQHADAARDGRQAGVELLRRLPQGVYQGTALLVVLPAFRRRLQAARAAIEQAVAELAFQLLQPTRDGSGRQVFLDGGRMQAARLDNGDKQG